MQRVKKVKKCRHQWSSGIVCVPYCVKCGKLKPCTCTNPKCKRVHYIKPEMSSVFKWKENPDGSMEELPKPVHYVNDPKNLSGDWPIDYWNYQLKKKPCRG